MTSGSEVARSTTAPRSPHLLLNEAQRLVQRKLDVESEPDTNVDPRRVRPVVTMTTSHCRSRHWLLYFLSGRSPGGVGCGVRDLPLAKRKRAENGGKTVADYKATAPHTQPRHRTRKVACNTADVTSRLLDVGLTPFFTMAGGDKVPVSLGTRKNPFSVQLHHETTFQVETREKSPSCPIKECGTHTLAWT